MGFASDPTTENRLLERVEALLELSAMHDPKAEGHEGFAALRVAGLEELGLKRNEGNCRAKSRLCLVGCGGDTHY